MKATKAISLILLVFVFASCTEVGPNIQLTMDDRLVDTTYVDLNLPPKQPKVVYLEEFTGVQCAPCPKGHETLEEIVDNQGNSVVVVGIQNDNPQASPYDGYPDYRTQEGIQISQNVGGSTAIPCADVDRVHFAGQNQIVIYSRNSWETFVEQRLGVDNPCNLELTVDYNAQERKARISTGIHFLQSVDSLTHLSIMIVENDIVSPQKQPDNSVDSNYVHQHMLRDMITPALGSITHSTTEMGRVVRRDYEYQLPEDINADNCKVVAFVHRVGGSQRVLQAAEVAVK